MSSATITMSPSDQAGVRGVIDGVYAAWAENDADAFVAGYAEEATAQLPGTRLAGREAVRGCMRAEFAGRLRGTRATHETVGVRLIGSDAAIVLERAAVLLPGQVKPGAETASLNTWVLSRRSGDWRVEAFHACPEHAG